MGGPPSFAQAGLPGRMRELQGPSPSGHRPSWICIHLLTSWLPLDREVATDRQTLDPEGVKVPSEALIAADGEVDKLEDELQPLPASCL